MKGPVPVRQALLYTWPGSNDAGRRWAHHQVPNYGPVGGLAADIHDGLMPGGDIDSVLKAKGKVLMAQNRYLRTPLSVSPRSAAHLLDTATELRDRPVVWADGRITSWTSSRRSPTP